MPYVYLQHGCTFGKSNTGEEFLINRLPQKTFPEKD